MANWQTLSRTWHRSLRLVTDNEARGTVRSPRSILLQRNRSTTTNLELHYCCFVFRNGIRTFHSRNFCSVVGEATYAVGIRRGHGHGRGRRRSRITSRVSGSYTGNEMSWERKKTANRYGNGRGQRPSRGLQSEG